MNRATRLGALLLACAGCAHVPARSVPAATSGPIDYDLPAPEPSATLPPPTSSVPAGAPSTASTEQAQAAARLAVIRASVDASLTAQAKVLWEAWTRGAPADLDASLGRREPVFSAATLAILKDARERASGDERRALSLLHAFVVGEHLSEMAAATLPIHQAALTWQGRAVPTFQVPALLAAEPDPARRAALEHAWAEAERRSGAADEARWKGIAAAARRIGYDSLLSLAAELRGEPIEALAALARAVLDATDAAHRALFQALAQLEMGKDLSGLRGRDLPRMLRASEDAHAFPSGRAGVDVRETLAALGLDLGGRPGVVLDLEPRQGKDPRPLALPIEVPGNVRVSFAPRGGAAELRALLHEMGAAAFYAHVMAQPLEFRRLGTVTAECWAFLFEDLAGDPAWLAERTGLAESHVVPIVRAAAARRLHTARTLAARILVEIARERDPAHAREAARAVLETAFAHPIEADELELFFLERDPLLESADRLRAILLAAQAESFLTGRAGASWWRSKASGKWLAAAFAEGSRLPPSELARTFGATTLDAAALGASTRSRAAAVGIRLAEAGQP